MRSPSLHEIDRAIDGTRLTGQAAYGWRPGRPDPRAARRGRLHLVPRRLLRRRCRCSTRAAPCADAHAAYPDKPIMVLEFGRWADAPADEERQRAILEETYDVLEARRGDELGGSWRRDVVEPARLRHPAGRHQRRAVRAVSARRDAAPGGRAAVDTFAAPAGRGDALVAGPGARATRGAAGRSWTTGRCWPTSAYALAVSVGGLGGLLYVLTRRGGRATQTGGAPMRLVRGRLAAVSRARLVRRRGVGRRRTGHRRRRGARRAGGVGRGQRARMAARPRLHAGRRAQPAAARRPGRRAALALEHVVARHPRGPRCWWRSYRASSSG